MSEVASLKVIDVLTPALNQQAAQLRVNGKGQKERIVLLTADAYAVLAEWLAGRPQEPVPEVFLNDRGQPLKANGIAWLLKGYGQQVALHVSPHQLRHTFARQVTEAGMPVTSLSKLLGHEQISTTQIYTAGADPHLREAYQQAMAQMTTPTAISTPPVPAPAPTVTHTLAPEGPTVPSPAQPDETSWLPTCRLLAGTSIELLPTNTLSVTLHWIALSSPNVDAISTKVFMHVVDKATGQVIAQNDHQPDGGWFPTNYWLKGDVINDQFGIPLEHHDDLRARPPGTDVGQVELRVGMYMAMAARSIPSSGAHALRRIHSPLSPPR